MDIVRIGLATLVSIVPSLIAFGLVIRIQKRREAAMPDAPTTERQRAERITASVGIGGIRLAQMAAIFCAIVPLLMLAGMILNNDSALPATAELVKGFVCYVGGWAVFGWCERITTALDSRASTRG